MKKLHQELKISLKIENFKKNMSIRSDSLNFDGKF